MTSQSYLLLVQLVCTRTWSNLCATWAEHRPNKIHHKPHPFGAFNALISREIWCWMPVSCWKKNCNILQWFFNMTKQEPLSKWPMRPSQSGDSGCCVQWLWCRCAFFFFCFQCWWSPSSSTLRINVHISVCIKMIQHGYHHQQDHHHQQILIIVMMVVTMVVMNDVIWYPSHQNVKLQTGLCLLWILAIGISMNFMLSPAPDRKPFLDVFGMSRMIERLADSKSRLGWPWPSTVAMR